MELVVVLDFTLPKGVTLAIFFRGRVGVSSFTHFHLTRGRHSLQFPEDALELVVVLYFTLPKGVTLTNFLESVLEVVVVFNWQHHAASGSIR